MSIKQIIEERHSVRNYQNALISDDIKKQLNDEAATINQLSGFNMQIIYDEPSAFQGAMASYGKFNNVKNYIAMVATKIGRAHV